MKKLCCTALLTALVCVAALPSCKYSGAYQVVNAGNKFSISVPSWMKQQTDLKPGAAFQYANRYRNFYAIGNVYEKDSLKETLNEMMNNNLAILKKAMKNAVVSDSSAIVLGGLPGTRAEIFGKMGEENIYFSEVILAGNSRYYHLSIWTRGEDRKLRFKEDINRIFDSFREL